ncbi:MAG: hypothetical protein JWM98_1069 [Thermoleophilia bacterium]|nr:hypothetical protein [Thermoleophilia bacterium]
MITGVFRDGAESMAGLAKLVRSANHHVVGDAFRFTEEGVVDAAREVRGRGVEVDLLHSFYKPAKGINKAPLQDVGVQFHRTWVMQHGKAMSVDGERMLVGTGAIGKPTLKRNDVAVLMDGAAPEAYERLERAAFRHDVPAGRVAAADAKAAGLLVNDPALHVTHLTESLEQFIATEPVRLDVVTKAFRDPELASMLAARAEHIPVSVVARDMDPEVEATLRSSKVDLLHLLDPAHHSHVNLVVGSEQAYLGSAHLTPRAMNRASNIYPSREIGALVDDPSTVAALREVADQVRATGQAATGAGSVQERATSWVRSKFLKRLA